MNKNIKYLPFRKGVNLSQSSKQNYPPSWLNRLSGWIASLQFSKWYFLSGLFIILLLIFGFLSRAISGTLPQGNWTSFHYYDITSAAIIIVGILAFYQYFESEIADTVEITLSDVKDNRELLKTTIYRFINLPRNFTLVLTLTFFMIGIAAGIDQYGLTKFQIKYLLLLLEFGLGAGFLFIFAYHLLRFIFQVRTFFIKTLIIDLYNLHSLHLLPSLAAKAGFFYLILFLPNLFFNLDTAISSPIFLLVASFASLAPLAAFTIPLASLSGKVTAIKNREINSINQNIKSAYHQVSKNHNLGKLDDMGHLESVISNLLSQKAYVETISIWPWREGTFRLTLTAVVLPLLVFMIQQLLDRLL